MTRGTVVLAAGWREVDPPGRERQAADDDAGRGEALPRVRAHDAAETRQAETLASTPRPRRAIRTRPCSARMETAGKTIDDEELRLAMKDAGLGTPRRAPPSSRRCSRGSTWSRQKSLVATPKGVALVSTSIAAAHVGGAHGAMGAEARTHGAWRVRV